MNFFLSHLHTELRRARLTKRGASRNPDEILEGVYKKYPRMPRLQLPQPRAITISLAEALHKRRSGASGDSEVPLHIDELGTLFGLALKKNEGNNLRNYPSGGSLYPIETYLISTAIESEPPAVYHYNPGEHVLERLWNLPTRFTMKDIAKKPESLPLSSLVVFTSVWDRSAVKYGDLGYLHAVLEAGHMSENILLVGCALGLNVRPYAGFNDARIAELLDLNESLEQSVHTVTLCKNRTVRIAKNIL